MIALAALFLSVGIQALRALVFQFIWNLLIPDMFGAPMLGFWAAWGLIILASIIFGDPTVAAINATKGKDE